MWQGMVSFSDFIFRQFFRAILFEDEPADLIRPLHSPSAIHHHLPATVVFTPESDPTSAPTPTARRRSRAVQL